MGWGDYTDWEQRANCSHGRALCGASIGRDPMQVEAIWAGFGRSFCSAYRRPCLEAMSASIRPCGTFAERRWAHRCGLLDGKLRDRLRLYWTHCGSMRSRGHAAELGVEPVETLDDLRALCDEVPALLHGDQDQLDGCKACLKAACPTGNTARPVTVRRVRKAAAIIGTLRERLGPDVGITLGNGLYV